MLLYSVVESATRGRSSSQDVRYFWSLAGDGTNQVRRPLSAVRRRSTLRPRQRYVRRPSQRESRRRWTNWIRSVYAIYIVFHKKRGSERMSITLSNLNRF